MGTKQTDRLACCLLTTRSGVFSRFPRRYGPDIGRRNQTAKGQPLLTRLAREKKRPTACQAGRRVATTFDDWGTATGPFKASRKAGIPCIAEYRMSEVNVSGLQPSSTAFCTRLIAGLILPGSRRAAVAYRAAIFVVKVSRMRPNPQGFGCVDQCRFGNRLPLRNAPQMDHHHVVMGGL